MSKKGQVAIEVLVLVGIIVIGMVIFGLFYIGKHPDQISDIDEVTEAGMARSVINYSDVTTPSRIVCGNQICESGETPANCPTDCQPSSGNQTLCGNGTIDAGEDCDGTNLNNHDCITQGFNAGNLSCYPNCTFNKEFCYNYQTYCGDSIIQPPEECDRDNLNNQNCQTHGYLTGTLSCTDDCEYNYLDCGYFDDSNCSVFSSDGWRYYNTKDPAWYDRGQMETWPDKDALWLCPNDDCSYIIDYYFLYNYFKLYEKTNVTIYALGDDETKVWLWPDSNISREIEVIPRHVWIKGWTSGSIQLEAGYYPIVQLIYDTNRASTGAILSVKNSDTGEVLLNTILTNGWRYYKTRTQLEEERYSSDNACSTVFSNQKCGNNRIEGSEQCDGADLGVYDEQTCSDYNSSYYDGELKCHAKYCHIDTSDCKSKIKLTVAPASGTTRRNRDFSITVSVTGKNDDEFSLVASIYLKNTTTGKYESTKNCKYVTTGDYNDTFDLGRFKIPINNRSYSFNCNTAGEYKFTFTGTHQEDVVSEASSIRKIIN